MVYIIPHIKFLFNIILKDLQIIIIIFVVVFCYVWYTVESHVYRHLRIEIV